MKNSGNMYQILLSGYFRKELTQKAWGRDLSQEGLQGPAWLYSQLEQRLRYHACKRYFRYGLPKLEKVINILQPLLYIIYVTYYLKYYIDEETNFKTGGQLDKIATDSQPNLSLQSDLSCIYISFQIVQWYHDHDDNYDVSKSLYYTMLFFKVKLS